MIKKLRIKFIVMSMISILIVLFVIICGINVSNYQSVSNGADNILKTLYENGGRFKRKERVPYEEKPEGTEPYEYEDRYENMEKNPEMPYETRFFTVIIRKDESDNKTYEVLMDFIKAIETEDEAINYANRALKRDNNKGYVGVYRYLYGTNEDGSTLVIFLDCRKGLDNAESFLKSSLIISLIGYVCVVALIVVVSKYVFKPVDEAYQKQKRFISNASHELKTPLTIISANNEINEMLHGSDESTDAIKRQVNRLNQMVTSLSLLTKLSEKKKLDKTEIFNFSDAINDIICDTNIMNYEKNVNLNIDSNITYNGEEGLIRQLISILLDNAIKYSNSYININLYNNGKNIVFETINDCYQIEDGIHNEVFERFYRSDNIRSKTEGSGIGLSIAKEIVDLHKGKIKAESINNNFKIEIIL